MKRGLVLSLAGVSVLAMVLVIGKYAMDRKAEPGPGGAGEAAVEGKLSRRLLDLEAKFKDTQAKWKAIEAEATKPGNARSKEIKEISDAFRTLSEEAKQIEGGNEAEKAGLPHLRASLAAAAQVPEIFLLYAISSEAVSEANHLRSVEQGKLANQEWGKWLEATRGLKR